MIKQTLKISALVFVLVPLVTWAALALCFDTGPAASVSLLPCLVYLGISIAALLVIRPFRRALGLALALFLLVLIWWLQLSPSNTRNWIPDVEKLASAEFQGDLVTINNVRNFEYKSETEFTPRWEQRQIDLSKVTGVDLFLSYWGSPWIAHTIASWEFEDGTHLAISIETRKEQGEEYSALRGFFRQYELYYVVADERDVVRLRSNFRNESVYLYRIQEEPQFARALLVDYLQEVNRLAQRPRWYNAFSHNCTTTIRNHRINIGRAKPFNWRILVNGFLDRASYESGTIDNSLPFEELKRRSLITERALAAQNDPEFSRRIREQRSSGAAGQGSSLAADDASASAS
jgi:hypothetical protein